MLINVRLAQLEEPLVGPLPAWSVCGARGAVMGMLGARLLFQMPTPCARTAPGVGLCVCTRDCHLWAFWSVCSKVSQVAPPPDGRNVKMPAQPCGTPASGGT